MRTSTTEVIVLFLYILGPVSSGRTRQAWFLVTACLKSSSVLKDPTHDSRDWKIVCGLLISVPENTPKYSKILQWRCLLGPILETISVTHSWHSAPITYKSKSSRKILILNNNSSMRHTHNSWLLKNLGSCGSYVVNLTCLMFSVPSIPYSQPFHFSCRSGSSSGSRSDCCDSRGCWSLNIKRETKGYHCSVLMINSCSPPNFRMGVRWMCEGA